MTAKTPQGDGAVALSAAGVGTRVANSAGVDHLIHVMEHGHIIEAGSHDELLDRDGFYADSWKRQMNSAPNAVLREA